MDRLEYYTTGTYAFTTLGTTEQLLNLTETGYGEQNRIGDCVVGRTLIIRFHTWFSTAISAFPTVRALRLIVIRVKGDKAGNISAPSLSSIFETTGLASNEYNLATYNRETMGDLFEVLHDHNFVLDTGTQSTRDHYITLKVPYITRYRSVSLSTDYIYQNALYLIAIPYGQVSSTDGVQSLTWKSNWSFNTQ